MRNENYKRLLRYMETDQSFLNPNISLMSLGRKVLIPPRSISEHIHIMEGKKFYAF